MLAVELVDVNLLLFRFAVLVAIIITTYVVAKLFSEVLRRGLRSAPPIMADQAVKGVSVFVWAVGLLLAVNQLGLNLDILLVLTAIGGFGLIVAARDVLNNILSKVFMGVYIPVELGDQIVVDGFQGKVIEINHIATVILTDDGSVAAIPNSKFVKEICVNKSSYAPHRVSIPVSIPSKVDPFKAEAEILKTVYKYKPHLDQRFPPIFTVKGRGGGGVEGVVDILVANPEMRETITSELITRIKEVLERFEKEADSKKR